MSTIPKNSSFKALAFDSNGEPASTIAVFSYWTLPPQQRHENDRGKGLVGRGIREEVELTGDGRCIDLGDLQLAAPATIALWINGETLDDDQRFFVHRSGSTDQAGQLRFLQQQLQVYDGIGQSCQTLIADGLKPGEWSHIAMVYRKDGTVTGYLNGKVAQSGTSAFAFHGVHAAIGGKWLGQWGNKFRGTVRDVRLTGTALDAEEIKAFAKK